MLLPPLGLSEQHVADHSCGRLPCAAEHPWLSGKEVSDAPLGNEVLRRLKNFCAANKMKKLALKVCIPGGSHCTGRHPSLDAMACREMRD